MLSSTTYFQTTVRRHPTFSKDSHMQMQRRLHKEREERKEKREERRRNKTQNQSLC